MYFMKVDAKFWNKISANCIKSYMKVRNWQTFSLKAVLANNIDFVSHKVSVAVIAAAAAGLLQSCLTLCDPIDSSPPGSAIPGILQAIHWSGLPFPSPMHESEVAQLCPTLSDHMDYSPPGPLSMGFSRQEYWSGVPLQLLSSAKSTTDNMSMSVSVLIAQLCPTLCNPMDCSPPGSPVHGILQAKILE